MATAELKVDVAGTPVTLALAEDASNVDTAGSLPVVDPGARVTLASILSALAGTLAVDTGLTTQTDALTDTQIRATPLDVLSPRADGTWSYEAGTAGTVNVTGRVIGLTALAGASDGSLTVNGGDAIVIPADTSIEINPRGNLTSPTLVFAGTDSFFVEVVT